MPTKIELCNASDVDVGAVLKVEKDDLTLAVFNLEGEFFVTDDHCTHGPGSLSEGFVEGEVVECNFHGGQFNIRTGAGGGPPCMVPIKTHRTVRGDGEGFIEVGGTCLPLGSLGGSAGGGASGRSQPLDESATTIKNASRSRAKPLQQRSPAGIQLTLEVERPAFSLPLLALRGRAYQKARASSLVAPRKSVIYAK